MPTKTYKPTTPARRYMSVSDFSSLSKGKKREKSLTSPIKKKAGRNVHGRITVRHRGGGAKRFYRHVDFKRNNYGQEGVVSSIEYDPNRTAFIMLVKFGEEKRYLLAPEGIKENDKVVSSDKQVEASHGNRMPLEFIPDGSFIYNIELSPGNGGSIVRSAGSSATLMTKEGNFAQIKLPSGEIRIINLRCAATVGQVSNVDHGNTVVGKAGRQRHKGIRPTVRGKAMNPVDHPHGGGEGRSPIGLKHPKTPKGKPALGRKTRKKNKKSNKFIVRARSKKRR